MNKKIPNAHEKNILKNKYPEEDDFLNSKGGTVTDIDEIIRDIREDAANDRKKGIYPRKSNMQNIIGAFTYGETFDVLEFLGRR